MPNVPDETKVAILLRTLGAEIAEPLLAELPGARAERLRRQLTTFDQKPPSRALEHQVLGDFERLLAFIRSQSSTASQEVATAGGSATAHSNSRSANSPEVFQSTGDPVEDFERLSVTQLEAALNKEHPRTLALILNSISQSRAGELLAALPAEVRDATVLQLKSQPTAPDVLIQRILRTAVDKAAKLNEQELLDARESVEKKMAALLKNVERNGRNQILASLEESDAEAVTKIRELMYSIDDLEKVEDRSIQKLLTYVDTSALSVAILDVNQTIKDKVLANLSKRARETLVEEMELSGKPSEEARTEANRSIVQALIQMDQAGELQMITD